MSNFTDGFVKLFARTGTRIIVGGVVVAPQASENSFTPSPSRSTCD